MAQKNKDLKIPAPPQTPQKLAFSFQFYDDRDESKYCLSAWEQTEIKMALKRLKEISALNHNEMQQRSRVLHFHAVDWSQASETKFPNGAPSKEAYQFSLQGINGQKARVFGAYYQGVFHIVWFDREHSVWPTELKNT